MEKQRYGIDIYDRNDPSYLDFVITDDLGELCEWLTNAQKKRPGLYIRRMYTWE